MLNPLLFIIIVFSYLLIGAIVASAWEKIELILLENGFDIKPWLSIKYYLDPSWYPNWSYIVLFILYWPFWLLIVMFKYVYLLIRKTFRLK